MENSCPLLIFDFDGVIVDGICEYWWSARQACLHLIEKRGVSISKILPVSVPNVFKALRPWVNQGWEMVLIAAELLRDKSPLLIHNPNFSQKEYKSLCNQAMESWEWNENLLQEALDNVRRNAIKNDLNKWLAFHHTFPGVVEFITKLNSQGIGFVVLSTKGEKFTYELLHSLDLRPTFIFGHESGSKTDILLKLIKNHHLKGFIEDRRNTLEKVLITPGLESLRCYLASWGYLKPEDKINLSPKISLIDLKKISTPLASWL